MKTERKILKPMPGVAREIGFYLSVIEETRAGLSDAVADLTKEELERRVTPKAHQIADLMSLRRSRSLLDSFENCRT